MPNFLYDEDEYEDVIIQPARLLTRQRGQWFQPYGGSDMFGLVRPLTSERREQGRAREHGIVITLSSERVSIVGGGHGASNAGCPSPTPHGECEGSLSRRDGGVQGDQEEYGQGVSGKEWLKEAGFTEEIDTPTSQKL